MDVTCGEWHLLWCEHQTKVLRRKNIIVTHSELRTCFVFKTMEESRLIVRMKLLMMSVLHFSRGVMLRRLTSDAELISFRRVDYTERYTGGAEMCTTVSRAPAVIARNVFHFLLPVLPWLSLSGSPFCVSKMTEIVVGRRGHAPRLRCFSPLSLSLSRRGENAVKGNLHRRIKFRDWRVNSRSRAVPFESCLSCP